VSKIRFARTQGSQRNGEIDRSEAGGLSWTVLPELLAERLSEKIFRRVRTVLAMSSLEHRYGARLARSPVMKYP